MGQQSKASQTCCLHVIHTHDTRKETPWDGLLEALTEGWWARRVSAAGAVDAKAADGGGAARHPQLLVAAEEAQVGHEPVAKGLPLPGDQLKGRHALLRLVA